jgi:hypothetical protein
MNGLRARLDRLETELAQRRRAMRIPTRDEVFDRWIDDAMSLSLDERIARKSELTPMQRARLRYQWRFWARPEQLPPEGAWTYWAIKAGRGWGKTRAGAEMVRTWAGAHRYVNLIGATSDDARDIMIEGESGVLACCPPDERPE